MNKIRYDPKVDAQYITLSESPIDHTVEVTDCVLVDIDAAGKAVGIDISGLDAAPVIVFSRPDDDPPPCITSVQFLIRDNQLITIAAMRSLDSQLGMPYDVHAFRNLAKYLAGMTNSQEGILFIQAGSFHTYQEREGGE